MNPVLNTSSCQGIAPPPETGKENEGTDFAKKPSKSMAGGLSVSLAAEGDTPSIASASRNTDITEAATLSHREIGQKKGMASTTSVNKTNSEQTQLQRESETVGKLEKPATDPKGKGVNGDQHQEMLKLIDKANKLMLEPAEGNGDRSKTQELAETLEPVSEYVNMHNDDIFVTREFYRCRAYALYLEGETEEALCFFTKSEALPTDHVNLPEGLFIMRLMLGMNTPRDNSAFKPEAFRKELEIWSRPDTIDKIDTVKWEGIEHLFEPAGKTGIPGLKIFFDGVKLFRKGVKMILEGKNINTEASRSKFEQIFSKLAWYSNEDQSLSLKNSDHMLKFARDLMLIEHGLFHEALESAGKNESGKFEHMNDYICCRALEALGDIDEAIERCRQCTSNGYPFFSDYLKTLESRKMADTGSLWRKLSACLLGCSNRGTI